MPRFCETVIRKVCEDFGATLTEFNGERDHLHLPPLPHPLIWRGHNRFLTVLARRVCTGWPGHTLGYVRRLGKQITGCVFPVGVIVTCLLTGCASAGSATDRDQRPVRGGDPRAVRTDVPEPATAPALTRRPAGTVVAMPGSPEGLAVDDRDGIVAIGLRSPDAVALADTSAGRIRKMVRLSGAARHLQLAGPSGPVLVPDEEADRLLQIALPSGTLVANTKVGRQPHDAAAAGLTIFVGNEYSNTVSLIRDGKQVAVMPSPVQPGGVAAARDGSVVVVVGVRGRRIEAYTPDGRSLGSAPCGVGSTHVRAGPNHLFYVADTEGNQVPIFAVGQQGPRQVGSVPTLRGGTPYGIAVDSKRRIVYVTLTASNVLESFRIKGEILVPDRQWPTVRQPNDVAVDETTGRVFVAGRDNNQLELIDP
jgi:DNA-binding beta-propeller fold protein YncE